MTCAAGPLSPALGTHICFSNTGSNPVIDDRIILVGHDHYDFSEIESKQKSAFITFDKDRYYLKKLHSSGLCMYGWMHSYT